MDTYSGWSSRTRRGKKESSTNLQMSGRLAVGLIALAAFSLSGQYCGPPSPLTISIASPALSANVDETPAPLGITVGRWKVRTDGSREGLDDFERASRPRAGG